MTSLPRVLIIAGLTASGKTDLALSIARQLPAVDIISADSRQFYQGPRIISGQDVPAGFTRSTSSDIHYTDQPAIYFHSDSIRLWGVDQLSPDQILNLSDYVDFVWQIIDQAVKDHRTVIIVGGTGLYLKAITQPFDRLSHPPDSKLRQELDQLDVDQLQQRLHRLDSDWLARLNHSDRHNPRRLIRAIEVSSGVGQGTTTSPRQPVEFRWLGLKPDLSTLEDKIHARVLKRLDQGALDEVKSLLKDYSPNLPALSALGIKYIRQYLHGDTGEDELIKLWTQQELSYAKDQWTWFKKQPAIIWYDENTDRQQLTRQTSVWLTDHDCQEED